MVVCRNASRKSFSQVRSGMHHRDYACRGSSIEGVVSASKIPPQWEVTMTSSRREFLKTAGAAAAASVLPSRVSRADGAIPAPLQEFGYNEVELLEGPLRHQFDTNHSFYGAMDEDALLKPFREKAGVPAPGEDMGGWYSWAPLSDLDKPG